MYHPRFKGDHYHMGLKYGSLLKRNKAELFGLNSLDKFQLNYGRQSEKILQTYFPEACDEIRGMTDGLNIEYQNFSAWLMCISVCLEAPGCTMVACKKDNRIVFGRNNDLPPIFQKISSSSLYAPANGYRFIANSSAFVNAEDGINEKGLAVGMTYVWARELKPGFSSMFFVRYILEKCSTAEEGLKAIQTIPIGGAYHLIMADRKTIIHVECSPQDKRISERNFAIASNHFVSEKMKVHEENKDLYHSHTRYKTAYEAISKGIDTSIVNQVKRILSGQTGFMCQYDKKENFDTVWSSVYDLSHQKIYRAEGNPSRKKYEEDTRLF